jgi:hypothetical protein
MYRTLYVFPRVSFQKRPDLEEFHLRVTLDGKVIGTSRVDFYSDVPVESEVAFELPDEPDIEKRLTWDAYAKTTVTWDACSKPTVKLASALEEIVLATPIVAYAPILCARQEMTKKSWNDWEVVEWVENEHARVMLRSRDGVPKEKWAEILGDREAVERRKAVEAFEAEFAKILADPSLSWERKQEAYEAAARKL